MSAYGGELPGKEVLEKGQEVVEKGQEVVKSIVSELKGHDLVTELLKNLLKYLIQGLAVAIAAHYIPKANIKMSEVLMIALTSASTFAILEMYAPPGMHMGSMFGTGFSVGQNLVNM